MASSLHSGMNGDSSIAPLQGDGAANDGVWSALLSKATRKAKENNATIVLLGQCAGWILKQSGYCWHLGVAGRATACHHPSRSGREGSRIWERTHAPLDLWSRTLTPSRCDFVSPLLLVNAIAGRWMCI